MPYPSSRQQEQIDRIRAHPGRPKGSKNKFTIIKDGFLWAYKKLGGKEALLKWAKGNQESYYKHVVSLLPREVSHEGQSTVKHEHKVIDYAKYGISREEAKRIANDVLAKRSARVTNEQN